MAMLTVKIAGDVHGITDFRPFSRNPNTKRVYLLFFIIISSKTLNGSGSNKLIRQIRD
jgi:hypothetical protein